MAKSDRAFRALSRSQPDVVAEMLRVLVPGSLPPGVEFTLDDMAPTQIDALPQAMDADCMARVGNDEMRHIEFQGYRDTGFSERCVWYHVGGALRYRGKRRVRSIAIWLTPLPKDQPRNVMRCDDISVRVKTIVLPSIPAAKLLANPKTVCLAAGANRGSWSDEELCRRVAVGLREHQASWPERHVAVVAALMQKRYGAMVAAMEQVQLEPVIIEDLVKFGEDRGVDRGATQERLHAFEHRLGRPLSPQERNMVTRAVTAMTAQHFYELVFGANPKALATWLKDLAAK